MAVTSTPFNRFRYLIGNKKVDFAADTFKMMLVPTTFVQAIDAQGAIADLTGGNAPITANLSASAVVLTGQALTEDDAADRAKFSSAMAEFTATGEVNAIGAIIYDDTIAAPDADALVTYIAFGETKTLASGEKLQITCPTTGWLTV